MNIDELFDIYTCVVCKGHMLLDMSRFCSKKGCEYTVATKGHYYRAYFKLGEGYAVADRDALKLLYNLNRLEIELNFDIIQHSNSVEDFLIKVVDEVNKQDLVKRIDDLKSFL